MEERRLATMQLLRCVRKNLKAVMKQQMQSAPVPLQLSFTIITGLGKQNFSNVINGLGCTQVALALRKQSFRAASHLQRLHVCERERDHQMAISYILRHKPESVSFSSGVLDIWNPKMLSVFLSHIYLTLSAMDG